MTYYRLLRDNKESGPFSEEEMISKGFKPYDLLWVEGKSAGWRYPSEIPAFKSFAPIVEEQPYDRFYKKPSAQTAGSDNTSLRSVAAASASNDNDLYVAAGNQRAALTEKPYQMHAVPGAHIHVTLPSGNRVNLSAIAGRLETAPAVENAPAAAPSSIATDNKKQSIRADEAQAAPTAVPVPAPVSNATASTYKNNGFANAGQPNNGISASALPETLQPLPEAAPVAEPVHSIISGQLPFASKTMAAAAPPVQPFPKKPVWAMIQSGNFSWGLVAASFVGLATLVGLGIMIGLAISRDNHDKAFNEALLSRAKLQPVHTAPVKEQPSTAPTDEPAVLRTETVKSAAIQPHSLVQNAVVKSSIVSEADSRPGKKKPREEKPVVVGTIATEQHIPAGNERTAIHRGDVTVHEKTSAAAAITTASLEKHLSLAPNDYKTGAFGGISNLKYTLTNSSRFLIESVEVEVDYIQANNKVYKTEKLFFHDIGAGAQITMDAPASSRGIKMQTRIVRINAKDVALSNTAKS